MNRLFLYIVLPFFILLTMTGCRDKKQKIGSDLIVVPGTASGKTNDKYPIMTFDKTKHEFGQVQRGEKISYKFKFTNTGKAPLIISSVAASCNCTVPEYSKLPVQPGEEGTVTLTFNSSGLAGFVTKSATVVTNAQPTSHVLTITANVASNH